jgi:outer membrane receptor protein involved in Fe transport
MSTRSRSLSVSALVIIFFLSVPSQANSDAGELLGMSIDQLMEVPVYVPASLTEQDPLKVPASVTVITADDIAHTPARNMLDLMEVYVPGFFWIIHSTGPLPAMRGIVAERPYKFLVNVNGINVNIKTDYGARLELLNWELSDIERIEVIRGPGSVTYGPGAIAGVINIYTKTASDAPGLAIGGHFWDKYDSIGNYVSYGHKTDKLDLYTYFSVVHTSGHEPDLFSAFDSDFHSGYLGHVGAPKYPYPAAEYLKDYRDQPHIKAMLDVHFKDTWRFWARYVTSSHDLMQGNSQQFLIPGTGGKIESFRQARYRYYQFTLENRTALNDNWNLKSTFGLSSIDVHDVQKYNGTGTYNGWDDLQNIRSIFAEDEYYAQFMFNYNPKNEKIKGAFGFEFSYDTIGPAWGKNKDNGLRIDSIISGPSSDAYGTGSYQVADANFFVGKGWETFSHAFLGELNIQATDKTTVILSARFDKHTYTDYMFSPRAALIYQLKDDQYLKFIAQRSVRINTQDELLMNHRLGIENEPEKLDTLELIYSNNVRKHWSLQTSVFYNKNLAIAWDWARRQAGPVGTLQTIGVEIETKYKKNGFELGANHSIVKQLNWKLAPDVNVSGISYSDYYQDIGTGRNMRSKGNDLNNWYNQATKLFTNIDLFDGKVTVHGDTQIFWGMPGARDGLDAFVQAGGSAAQYADIKRHHPYETQAVGNVSFTYNINKNSGITVFVENIPLIGDNKRYGYSSGFKNDYADKVCWIEEPTVVGFRYHVTF